MITLTDMVAGFEEFPPDRYIAAAMFADDVREVLTLAKRPAADCDGRLDDALREVRPGQWEFECDGRPYTLQVRKSGLAELQRGHGLASFQDKCPVPLLAVKKAEALKEGLVHETFFLLKGLPIKNDGGADMPRRCFVMHRRLDEWESYHDGLTGWVKRVLWPEVEDETV